VKLYLGVNGLLAMNKKKILNNATKLSSIKIHSCQHEYLLLNHAKKPCVWSIHYEAPHYVILFSPLSVCEASSSQHRRVWRWLSSGMLLCVLRSISTRLHGATSQKTVISFVGMWGFKFSTSTSMKMAVFWDVALCTPVNIYQTTRRYIPEDSHLLCQFVRSIFVSSFRSSIKQSL
jgi:hypothetical protein